MHTINADVTQGDRKLSKRQKQQLRRRLTLEAVIGYMEVDGYKRDHIIKSIAAVINYIFTDFIDKNANRNL